MGLRPRADPLGGYAAAVAQLFASRRFGVDLGVERIAALLSRLEHPHRDVSVRAVIGGTNGKGSTSAFLESIGQAAGRRTGVFSSPHLARFTERFRIDGQSVSEHDVALAYEEMRSADGVKLTFFEQCTALATLIFRRLNVDLAIYEVGLGGRLDSTRVVEPHAVGITGVALDHQDVLGETLAAIAAEKLGVADPQTSVVVGTGGATGSLAALLAAAQHLRLGRVTIAPARPATRLGLAGHFQRANADVAAALATELGFSAVAIEQGLARASLPARFETLAFVGPEVIVDGAHNPHGAKALRDALALLPARPTVLVVGVSQGKDVSGIADALHAVGDSVWASAATGDRAMPSADVAAPFRERGCATQEIALDQLASRIGDLPISTRVVATGSLMFVGALRARLLGEPEDELILTDPPSSL